MNSSKFRKSLMNYVMGEHVRVFISSGHSFVGEIGECQTDGEFMLHTGADEITFIDEASILAIRVNTTKR